MIVTLLNRRFLPTLYEIEMRFANNNNIIAVVEKYRHFFT